MTRPQLAQLLHATGVVPLFHHADPAVAGDIVAACYRAGVRAVEFTNRAVRAHEVFRELAVRRDGEWPGLALGVGSIAEPGTAALYMQLGADFVVTPALRDDVIRACNRRKVLCIPGCTTPTEVGRAEELGAEIVKLFPGELLGPSFVRGLLAPQPWTSVMVTGGVTPARDNLAAWFAAGVTCVGMGSKLVTRELVAQADWAQLEAEARKLLEVVAELRNR